MSKLQQTISKAAATALRVNPRLVQAQYAVRGLIPSVASEIEAELAAGSDRYPFSSLVWCNIGNPQALEQRPLTFPRQVLALFQAPFLLDNPAIVREFPPDAVARARRYLTATNGVTGAYTASPGFRFAREAVATYVNARDAGVGPPARYEEVILTDGASAGLRFVLEALMSGPTDAALTPLPQYPLYNALLTMLGAVSLPYPLTEEEGWAVGMERVVGAYVEGRARGFTPRLLVCINPNNPTGAVLDRDKMTALVRFCHDHALVLLVDEVYQDNVYAPAQPFVSFREVVLSSPEPYRSQTMLISLHSISKGILGECGLRGGYLHLLNVPQVLRDQLAKLCSMNLCANVGGQVMTALMCTPPQPGEPSHPQYTAEYEAIRTSLRDRAALLTRALDEIAGVRCQPVAGAMYAFPTIALPEGWEAFNAAANAREGRALAPDERWALRLLEATGVVVVPGSGFGQQPGTLHFRTTILPPLRQLRETVRKIAEFQEALYAPDADWRRA